MKKRFFLIFVSMFMVLSFVGGNICLNVDTLFSASTEAVEMVEEDSPTKVQTSGNWSEYAKNTRPKGSGTYLDPYQISSAQELANYMYMVNNYIENTSNGILYKNSCAELTADIDLSDHYWTPIGTQSQNYSGQFNGNGHTISGLYVNEETCLRDNSFRIVYGGLFGFLGGTSVVISNLILDNGLISLPNLWQGFSSIMYMGALVANACGDSTVKFTCKNVVNKGVKLAVSGSAEKVAVGGLIGICDYVEMVSCLNYVDIGSNTTEGSLGSKNISCGGLVGMAMKYVKINYCANFGMLKEHELSKSNAFGGIIGSIMAQNDGGYARSSIIEDCINYDDITIIDGKKTWETYCGGIIGVASNNTCVNRCVNYGDITGFGYSGGIAGVMGCSSNVGRFLFWSWEILPASQNVLIANCINYGSIGRYNKSLDSTNARIYLGSIVGLTTGESLKANISVFEIAYGISINDCGSYSDAASDISGGATDIYTLSDAANLCKEGFLPDYEGSSVSGLTMIWGWESGGYTPELNSQYYGWICTTVLVDLGLVSPPCSSYGYVLAHTEMLTTLLIYPQYRKEGSTSQKFDIKDDSIEIYANWISSNGNVNKENIWDKGNAVRFYTPRGFSSTKFTPLKIRYSTKDYKASSVEDDSSMFTANWRDSDNNSTSSQRYNYIQFEASVEDRVSLYLIFNIQLKKLPVTVKLGEFIEAKTWFSIFRTDADYKFETKASFDYSGEKYSSDYIAISEGESGYIPGENVNLNISPCYGYAVLCCFYFNSDNVDTYDYLSNIYENYEEFNCSKGDFESEINDNYIKPSNYGDGNLNFEFKRDYSLVIYLVPVKYNINVEFATVVGDDNGDDNITSDGNITGGLASYAFTGPAGTSNIEKSFSFNKSELDESENDLFQISDNNSQITGKNFFDYGFKYTLYASTYTDSEDTKIINTDTDFSEMEAITLYSPSDTTEQLNTNQELRFSMLNLVKTAVENSKGIKSNRIKIVVFRKAIEYTVEFVNMVDSFTGPGSFIDRTSQKIGGISSLKKGEEIETFNVLDNNVNFSMEPKPGYKMVGSSFNEYPNFTEDSEEDSKNVATGSMSGFLNNYIEVICEYDVESPKLKDNTIKIFVYYKLMTYTINIRAEGPEDKLKSEESKLPPGFEITSENCKEKDATSLGAKSYEVYYYAPVTISCAEEVYDDSVYKKFSGWWGAQNISEADNKYTSYSLLTPYSTEYTFFLDPNKVWDGNFVGSGGGDIFDLNLVSVYNYYELDRGSMEKVGENVIEVSSAQDLIKLSTSVLMGESFEGYVIKQTADIDMQEELGESEARYLLPIGTKDNPFKWIYDGQNHIIRNILYENIDCSSNYRYDLGMFGYTSGATIKNLTIMDSKMTAYSDSGFFVAHANNTKLLNLHIYNCDFDILGDESIYSIHNEQFSADADNYGADTIGFGGIYYDSESSEKIYELENAQIEIVKAEHITRYRTIIGRSGETTRVYTRMKIGGIAGEAINGSVVYGCSVIAKIYVRENVGYKITCIGGIVGMIEEEGAFDDPMEATVVQECMVEATNTSTSNFLTIIGSLAQHIKKDSDTGIEGDSSVSNCYYRIGNDTYYLFSMNSKTENSMEDSSNISYSFDANIWFRLPNGWWTLRVFYWT